MNIRLQMCRQGQIDLKIAILVRGIEFRENITFVLEYQVPNNKSQIIL